MIDFFNQILDFINTGIYKLLTEFVAYLISKISIFVLTSTLKMMVFSWDVAKQIMVDLQISSILASIYSHFNSKILELLFWLKVPDFINNVLTAYITRFVMRFVPFL